VEIPKPDGGVRLLGIPTVMDRLIQQAIAQVLTSLFDPLFSPHSHGFRPGRRAHDAVQAAQGYIREGYTWVVDIDLEKYFDQVNHDMLMTRVYRVVKDKRVLKLIRRYLQSGVMVNGVVMETEEGTPQAASPSSYGGWTSLPTTGQHHARRPARPSGVGQGTRSWRSAATGSSAMQMTATSMSRLNERASG